MEALLEAAIAAKIANDPGFLEWLIAKALGQPQTESSGAHAPPAPPSPEEEETRGRSTQQGRSLQRNFSTAPTEIIDDDNNDGSSGGKEQSPVRSCKESPPRAKNKSKAETPGESSPSKSTHRNQERDRSPQKSKEPRRTDIECSRGRRRSRSRDHRQSSSRDRRQSSSRSRSHPRSDSPERTINPFNPVDPKDIPKPPKGWMNEDYYDRMETSYAPGGGEGNSRGGRVYELIDGVKTLKSTFLEKLKTRKMKFAFIDKYGHPFARKLGIRHFNPYGYVPRDPKVVARIDRPSGNDWKLLVEVGAVGDYDWYLNARSLVRSLVDELKPDSSVLKGDKKTVTWRHFSSETCTTLYEQAYKALPGLFHFRDQTNKDSWFVAELARDYLSASRSYDSKRKHIRSDKGRMRRNATRIAENAAKQYPAPPREEDPITIFGVMSSWLHRYM